MPASEKVQLRVREVIARVFQADPQAFNQETRRGDLEKWDSLGHLTLIEALCSEFEIEIPPEDALDMETVNDITRIVHTLVDGVAR